MLTKLMFALHAFNTIWWLVLMAFFENQATVWNFLFNGLYGLEYLAGGLIGMYYYRRIGGLKSTIGTSVFFLSIGMILYSFGAFTWLGYNLFSQTELPYPSWADMFYSMIVPFFIIGLMILLKMYSAFKDGKRLIEFVISLAVIAGILLFVVVRPSVSADLPFGENFFNLFYPLGDSFLAALAFLIFRSSGGTVDKSALLFSAGLVIHTCADILFSYRTSHETYWNGDITDYTFAWAGFLLSLGIIKIVRGFVKEAKI